jgi:hypothetical protein
LKRYVVALFAVFLWIVLIGQAVGAPVTANWVDDWAPENGPIYLNGLNNEVAFQHDITDDGFTVGQDWVFNYHLSISLYDNGDMEDEMGWIDLPGLRADGPVGIDYRDVDRGWSLMGLIQLNLTGTLDITVQRISGDFYLDGSTLSAQGLTPSSGNAPLPSSLLLLAVGIATLFKVRGNRKVCY